MQNSSPVGVMAYTDYPRQLQNSAHNRLYRRRVLFDQVVWITTDGVATNYVNLKTLNEGMNLWRISMTQICDGMLPDYFVRVSNAYVINVLHESFEGLINGSAVVVNSKRINVSKRYREHLLNVLGKYFLL